MIIFSNFCNPENLIAFSISFYLIGGLTYTDFARPVTYMCIRFIIILCSTWTHCVELNTVGQSMNDAVADAREVGKLAGGVTDEWLKQVRKQSESL